MIKRLGVLALLLLPIVLSGCGEDGCNQDEVAEFLDTFERNEERWYNALRLAENTARIALSDRIADLQDITDDLRDIEAPECTQEFSQAVLTYRELTIEYLIDFMSDEPESRQARSYSAALEAELVVVEEMAKLYHEAELFERYAEMSGITVEEAEADLNEMVEMIQEQSEEEGEE